MGITGGVQMGKVNELHKKWSKNPEYISAYDKLKPEFEVARLLIEARTQAGLTQAQLAKRIQTTQSAVARFESGRIHPSTKTLQKIAQATGTRLKISLEAI
jgi:ribosome-binding protein aMBF1 (putative translation factor)